MTQIDKVHGIDRYDYSADKGQLVSPIILLWRGPGQAVIAANLSGALKHGDDVMVLEKRKHKRELWCKVRAVEKTTAEHANIFKRLVARLKKDLQPPEYQEGWVKGVMLEAIGYDEIKRRYGSVYNP